MTLQADLTSALGVSLKPLGYRKRQYNWYRKVVTGMMLSAMSGHG